MNFIYYFISRLLMQKYAMFFYKKTIYVKFIQFWVLRYFLSHDMPDQRYRAFYWYFLCSNQHVRPDDDDDDECFIILIQICYIQYPH